MKDTHIITIIRSDGTRNMLTCNKKSQYAFLRAAVGGNIETLPYFNKFEGKRCVAYCNEEGKLTGLPRNQHGQALWLDALMKRDGSLEHIDIGRTVIVGNVAVVTKGVNVPVDSVYENDPYGIGEERKRHP